MVVLPVVVRELIVQARWKSTYWVRVASSAIAGFLMLWLLVVGSGSVSFLSQGKTLFFVLSVLAFGYCLFSGAALTADSVSWEKREGTLGLLFLTDLKGHDVVLGKLVSSSVRAIYGLLAIVPMMSMALLFGGVTGLQVAATCLVLGNTLFLSLAVGILVSTCSRSERRAINASVLIILILSTVPYEIGFLTALRNPAGGMSGRAIEHILLSSPIYAFTITQRPALGPATLNELFVSVGMTHGVAWMLLGLASALVPRVCKDRPAGVSRLRWSEFWRSIGFGSSGRRQALRRRLLDRNPYSWLAFRGRYRSGSVWVLVVPLALIGLWVYTKYRIAFYEASLFLILISHLLLKIWFAAEVTSRWIEDKRSGALELILTVPLSTHEIVRGQRMALVRQFGSPVAAILILTWLAWVGLRSVPTGNISHHWVRASVAALIIDLWALRWVCLWLGITAKGVNRAMMAALGRVLCLRWAVYLLLLVTAEALLWVGYPQLAFMKRPSAWLLLALGFDLIFGLRARSLFLAHWRAAVSVPEHYKQDAESAADGDLRSGLPDSRGPSEPPATLWKPVLRRPVWIAAAVFCLGVIGAGGYRYFFKWKLGRRIAVLEAAGIPTTMQALAEQREAAFDEDAAFLLEQLFTAVEPIPVTQSTSFLFNNRDLSSEASMGQVRAGLRAYEPVLRRIHETRSLAKGRYEMIHSALGGRFFTEIQAFAKAARLLEAEAFVYGTDGDVARAVRSIIRLVELARSLDDELSQQFQMMRRDTLNRAFRAMEWILARHRLPDRDLAALAEAARGTAEAPRLWAEVVGLQCEVIDSMRDHSPVRMRMARFPPPSALEQLKAQLGAGIDSIVGRQDRALLQFIEEVARFRAVESLSAEEGYRKGLEIDRGLSPVEPTEPPGAIMWPPRVFKHVILPGTELVARCRVVETALAVERYRLRQDGRLPEGLEELVPAFLPEVPRDPFDGKSIRYRRLEHGFRIYSIGQDGSDDGGPGSDGRIRSSGGDIILTVPR